ISGTNAHVILEQAPPTPTTPEETPQNTTPLTPTPVPLSARTPHALREQAQRLLHHLDQHPTHLTDLAHSLATHKAALHERAVLLADTPDTLRTALTHLTH
ncbi:ketoacyl-synthetase C-terminal extension domain-containing protein, partial [Streptomyces galbus]